MTPKRTEKNYCFKHKRPKVATRMMCPNCMGEIKSPKRRRAALRASKAAAAARLSRSHGRKKGSAKQGNANAETIEDIF